MQWVNKLQFAIYNRPFPSSKNSYFRMRLIANHCENVFYLHENKSFSYRFETEAKGNSEMAYFLDTLAKWE